MAKKLQRYVTVDGVTYGPDDDVPADVAEKITNAKAWEDDATEPVSDAVVEAEALTRLQGGDKPAGRRAKPAATEG